VLRHGAGPPDLAFVHPFEVELAGESRKAWIWVPGYRNPPGLVEEVAVPAAETADDDSSGTEENAADSDDSAPASVRSSGQRGGITAHRVSGRTVVAGDHHGHPS
jgi:hypothetical protein